MKFLVTNQERPRTELYFKLSRPHIFAFISLRNFLLPSASQNESSVRKDMYAERLRMSLRYGTPKAVLQVKCTFRK